MSEWEPSCSSSPRLHQESNTTGSKDTVTSKFSLEAIVLALKQNISNFDVKLVKVKLSQITCDRVAWHLLRQEVASLETIFTNESFLPSFC
jgi:hypothetical protein